MRTLSIAVAVMAALWSAALAADAPSSAAASGVEVTHLRQAGLVGDFYRPVAARPLPAVIVLGGSEGGLGVGAAWEARLIAERGYAVLQLAYFDAPGLPAKLQLIPLEYFRRAVDWLVANPGVQPRRIGLVGTSIGGETALVVAAHDRRVVAVVAAVPSSVVWPGIGSSQVQPPSTYTLAGVPLPDLPYGWTGAFHGVYPLYADGLKALDRHPDAIIPVERINGPVMLVCGHADALWPSCEMSEQIVRRLEDKRFGHPVELLEYKNAGHAAFGPPVDLQSPAFAALSRLGGTLDGLTAARQDSWTRARAPSSTLL